MSPTTRRTVLWAVALCCFLLAFGLQAGSSCLGPARPADMEARLADEVGSRAPDLEPEEVAAQSREAMASAEGAEPPGRGIPALAMLQGLLTFTVLVMGLGFFVRTREWGRASSVLTLILAIVLLITAIFHLLATIALLLAMLGLFLAAPFGTIVYIAVFGFFPTGAAASILGVSILLDVVGAILLVVGQPRILTAKMFLSLFFTVLVAAVITSFLHGWFPGILVSITDAVAAIISEILTIIWAIVLLVTVLISLVTGLSRS